MNAPAVSAILVNFNAGTELRRALQSIQDELDHTCWDATVVDNHSTDGSCDIAREFAPRVRLIRNPDNVGFARAVNQALTATAAPRVLLMNPDCRLVAGAVETLCAELERHDRCAIVAPRILNPDGTIQGSARGDPNILTGLFGRTSALGRVLPGLEIVKRNVVTESAVRSGRPSVVVDWVSGACMLARRDALTAVQGFDERYFLYWEDADLCRRLRAVGYHVRYVPGATAVHRVGQSSQTARVSAIRAFHQSAYVYYTTHVAPGKLQPRRLFARAILGARCWVKLRH